MASQGQSLSRRHNRARRRALSRQGSAGPGGFTLIELLLVAAIIAVITAVTVPTFVRSIRGNRLRVATRTVIMAGRYARSMAVMQQRDALLRFDLDDSVIDVVLVKQKFSPDGGADGGGLSPGSAMTLAPEEVNASTSPPVVEESKGMGEISRVLDRVRIVSLEVEGGETPAETGTVSVTYRTHGRCAPYTVRLEDEDGRVTVIEVDALGTAETGE